MQKKRKQNNILFVFWNYIAHALFFFTRIPVGNHIVLDEKILIASRVLAPLVGLLIGMLCAATFIFFLSILGKSLAILLSMLAAVVLTGGFHEDALADSVDGFGAGGHSSKDIITIMKDSRIGTYGTLALIFSFALSFYSLGILSVSIIPVVIIFAHTTSRFAAVPLMFWMTYVRHDSVFEKATKTYEKDMSFVGVALGCIGVTLLGFWFFGVSAFWFLLVTGLTSFITGRYYQKRLGGVTGDCFGATIKIAEICCYLLAVMLYHL